MKWTLQKAIPIRSIFLAVLSGTVLTASFPPGKLSFLVWIAFVPLFKGLDNKPSLQAFKLGLITGATHYLTLMYWITVVLGQYGDLDPFSRFAVLLLLCLYLALYPAFFSVMSLYFNGLRFPSISMAIFWVGLEYIRAKFLTGFPWCLLGYTQYEHPGLIQIADIFGVYGISFLIILVNGLIYGLLFKHNEKGLRFLRWETLMTGLFLGGTMAYGHYRLTENSLKKETPQSVKAVIIQANIDQSIKWDPAFQTSTMAAYQRLTRRVRDFKPELIVWPETSLPFFFQDNVLLSSRVYSMVKESGAALIFGSPACKEGIGTTQYYNRAFLMTIDDRSIQYYDKIHLVPFGEYVPLKKILSFINRLVPAAGDFQSGNDIKPLTYGKLSIGVLICFEAIFPEIAREHAKQGGNILVNITNDAWFGMTSAPYQHLSMTVFRAVENRMPVIRSANTGFSAFIDSHGEIYLRGGLFREEVLKATVNISRSDLTIYSRFGDIFALSLLIISMLMFLSFIWSNYTGSQLEHEP
ncbi:MAG: apolipoprotein N-acyltransferase [Desulfobacterales bacterium]|nr:apolipoprotein N-acyltransferase [Desulfobacterales bacterium]